jgi:AAA15 family ATPase/GTPase
MVHRLSIKNYKSVKNLEINTKRINVFIGEHNSGKSNILEALSWFSPNLLQPEIFKQVFRYKNVGDFFYDFDGTQTIEVSSDDLNLKVRYARNDHGALLNHFEGIIYETGSVIFNNENWHENRNNSIFFNLEVASNIISDTKGQLNTNFKAYQFKRLSNFTINYRPYLNPPFGDNIPSLLQSNKDWKQMVSDFFKSKGFRLVLKPTENEIDMAKDVNDELYSFPYATISETMQRFIFLLLSVETNENSIIILDEPESNMFPFFVKDFGERISNDESNQYFISTHNPYLLGSLLEQTPLSDISVFITRMENYQTIVEECNEEQINELISLGSGTFFNLDNIRE